MGRFIAIVLAVILMFGFIDYIEPNGYGFFSKVSNGKVAVVTRFGKTQDETLEPGFHVKPFFSVLHPTSVQTQTMTVNLSAFSSDIQQVNTTVTITYNIDKTNAVTLYRDVGDDYETILMMPRVQEDTKIVFSHYTAESLVQQRDVLSTEILTLLQEYLTPYGVNVTAVAIEDIDFTDAFTNAVEAKQVATQDKLTAETEQERLTMEAEAEAEREKIRAEADADKAKIAADAEAYTTLTQAEAEAEANRLIANSLTPELIEYTQVQNWDGELPSITGGNTPIVDVTDFME
jgi:regulator of protease activity HflC (stomatin/prohibitin superfamily)